MDSTCAVVRTLSSLIMLASELADVCSLSVGGGGLGLQEAVWQQA